MTSSDFRQITIKGDARRAERLFRAAVSAFCALTRPSRRDVAQLEDLTLPLFDLVPVESRRYVAAALCECPEAPRGLIKRLCGETVDIAAPLLIRSTLLSDLDLVTLIARHGPGHARAIARRPALNPAIADLAALLERKAGSPDKAAGPAAGLRRPAPPEDRTDTAGAAAENARRRLRSAMRPGGAADLQKPAYERLRDTALTGSAPLFQTALADSLEIEFSAAGDITPASSYAWLLTALRALDLSSEQSFLVTAAIYSSQFPQAEAIRLFLARYRETSRETALERLAAWKAGRVASRGAPLAAGRPMPPASVDDAAVRQATSK